VVDARIALVASACPSGSLDGDKAARNDGHISVITLSDLTARRIDTYLKLLAISVLWRNRTCTVECNTILDSTSVNWGGQVFNGGEQRPLPLRSPCAAATAWQI